MSPNTDVVMRDNGQGRTAQAKPQAQGTMSEGILPQNQNQSLTREIFHFQGKAIITAQQDSIIAKDLWLLCILSLFPERTVLLCTCCLIHIVY